MYVVSIEPPSEAGKVSSKWDHVFSPTQRRQQQVVSCINRGGRRSRWCVQPEELKYVIVRQRSPLKSADSKRNAVKSHWCAVDRCEEPGRLVQKRV